MHLHVSVSLHVSITLCIFTCTLLCPYVYITKYFIIYSVDTDATALHNKAVFIMNYKLYFPRVSYHNDLFSLRKKYESKVLVSYQLIM